MEPTVTSSMLYHVLPAQQDQPHLRKEVTRYHYVQVIVFKLLHWRFISRNQSSFCKYHNLSIVSWISKQTNCHWYCFSLILEWTPPPLSELLEQLDLLWQGWQQFFVGFSFFVLGHNLCKEHAINMSPLLGWYKEKGNATDLILEHFIVSLSAYSGPPPSWGGWSQTVITIATQKSMKARTLQNIQ